MAIRPDLLQPGDKVVIIAPAGKVVEGTHQRAIQVFKGWGLVPEISKYALGGENYFSGTDEQRLEDFQSAINNPEIKAIFCARGGYGTTRIIDLLDFTALATHPKWIIGYSDITTVHFRMHNMGFESIHSVMPTGFDNANPPTISSLKNILFNDYFEYELPGNNLNVEGKTAATIIGGNLSLVVDSIGTASEIDATNKILFIEEIDEYLYKIDRMMVQLVRSGKLSNLAALIVGHMTGMKDTKVPINKSANELIHSLVSGYNYPVAFGIPIGHEDLNLAIPCSREIQLRIDNNKVNIKG